MLELNVKKYEKKCDDVVAQAKAKLNAGDRKGATLLMKKKKMYEKEISKLEGMQMFIEQQKLTMESNQNNANVFDTMKNAADQITELQKNADINDFDEIREQHEEQQEQQNEITDWFQQFAEEQGEDAEDLLGELEAEMAEAEMGGSVPAGKVKP